MRNLRLRAAYLKRFSVGACAGLRSCLLLRYSLHILSITYGAHFAACIGAEISSIDCCTCDTLRTLGFSSQLGFSTNRAQWYIAESPAKHVLNVE
jgi:hypothetical protein